MAKRVQLTKELHNLKMAANEGIDAYVGRVRKIWEQLTAAGHEVNEADVILAMLAGLPQGYDSLVDMLETSDEEHKMADTIPKLLVVEQRIARTGANSSGANYVSTSDALYGMSEAALYTNVKKAPQAEYLSRIKCFACGQRGHKKRDCPRRAKVLTTYAL